MQLKKGKDPSFRAAVTPLHSYVVYVDFWATTTLLMPSYLEWCSCMPPLLAALPDDISMDHVYYYVL